ncbi:MAG: hypothetical protein IIX42_06920 [Alistipes sp.]|nr:hypothetical protein [Alistipes sp.]MBQ6584863.1 hypothetical protein [Alistipes sp.]
MGCRILQPIFFALRPFLAPFYRQSGVFTTLRLSRGEQQSHTIGAKGEN